MTLHSFTRGAYSVALHELGSHDPHRYAVFVECYNASFGAWPVPYATGESMRDYLEQSPFAAIVYPDGSAQLLSRDEDECLLFQTLWELEK